MAFNDAVKLLAKNGKKAVRNGGNGVVEGVTNGNGAKESLNGIVTPQQAYVEKHLAKKNVSQKYIPTEETDTFLQVPDYGRTNYISKESNKRAPGGVYRADRPTKTKGPSSKITTISHNLYKLFPESKDDLDNWIRGAYRYARDPKTGTGDRPLKGYPYWIAPDGQYYKPKPNQKYGQGYSLKIDNVANRKATIAKRTSKEKPWKNNEARVEIMAALQRVGLSHKFSHLMKIMREEHDAKVRLLGGKSKGHIVSLADGGLDVAENFIAQDLKNRRVKKGGKYIVEKGNAAMGADSTGQLGTGITSWDQYIALKLSQL